MKVLVTGSSGFIGSHVVTRLNAAGYEVDGFDHRGRGTILGDIRDMTAVSDAMSHVDAFVHLAGLLGTQEHVQEPGPLMETNITGGLNVLQSAARFKVPGVCIGVGNHFMDNPYSISKSTVERLVSMFNTERGTMINIIRAMNAYGPGQVPAQPYGPSRVRKIAPSFICRALRGDPIEVYDSQGKLVRKIGKPGGRPVEGIGECLDIHPQAVGLEDRFEPVVGDFFRTSRPADVVLFEFCLHEMPDPGAAVEHARGLAPDVVVFDHAPGSAWAFIASEEAKVAAAWAALGRFPVRKTRKYETVQLFPDFAALRERVQGQGPTTLARIEAYRGETDIRIPMSYGLALVEGRVR